MNIEIDTKTFRYLMNAKILSIQIGSKLHGTDNDGSDSDILHIVSTPINWSNSFTWTHHSLLYKELNTDHIFITLQNFIRNILTGDSTINYESLYSKEIQINIPFLYLMRYNFKSFNILKSYLGFAQRDLLQYKKTNELKKLSHAVRGLWSYKLILKDEYSNEIKEKDEKTYKLLMDIKNGLLEKKELDEIYNESENLVKMFKEELSKLLNDNLIEKTMSLDKLKTLDKKLIEFCNKDFYLSKVLKEVPLEWIYKSLQ